jgi:probable F420-dependent oxidoreductase
VKLGAVFPQLEIGADPGGVRAYAQAVQQMGFQHLVIYDHVLGANPAGHPGWSGPYTEKSLFHEPMVVFGFLAAVVPGLELVTAVIILPQRQTALVAKQAAEVDVLSGGKLRLGVGIGWNAVEYEGLGMNFHNRGRRLEEQIKLMRRLWTEPIVTFEGQYHRITAAGINPLPVQRPIPVWIGASAEAAIKRAAEMADGFFPQRPLGGGWPATMEKIHGWLTDAGRDPARFGIEARINTANSTPDDWQRQAEEWRKLGATHMSINTMNAGLQGADAHVAQLQQALQVVQSVGLTV